MYKSLGLGGYTLIEVNIKFVLYLESASDLSMGKKSVSAELEEGAKFGDLLDALERNFGSPLANEIYDPQQRSMHDSVKATINGVLAHNLDDTETLLQHGDNIIFVPFVSGG